MTDTSAPPRATDDTGKNSSTTTPELVLAALFFVFGVFTVIYIGSWVGSSSPIVYFMAAFVVIVAYLIARKAMLAFINKSSARKRTRRTPKDPRKWTWVQNIRTAWQNNAPTPLDKADRLDEKGDRLKQKAQNLRNQQRTAPKVPAPTTPITRIESVEDFDTAFDSEPPTEPQQRVNSSVTTDPYYELLHSSPN